MSTRSYIGIKLPKKDTIKGIYVHSDGYIMGVGKTLVENYNKFYKAIQLFSYGDCSSIRDTIDSCSFYSRDWGRDEESKVHEYNNEWCFYENFKGDIFIEYIYLFKDDNWYVSEMYSNKVTDKNVIEEYNVLHTKPILVTEHKEYKIEDDVPKRLTEKEMVSKVGEALQTAFAGSDVKIAAQGFLKKKSLN